MTGKLVHSMIRVAGVFFIKDPDGCSIEVIDRGGRFG